MGPVVLRAGQVPAVIGLLVGCSAALPSVPVSFGGQEQPQVIRGLGSCATTQPTVLDIDPAKPLVMIVHGCFSSGTKFRRLAQIFRFHGQQATCFNYEDRNSLRATARALRRVLHALRARMGDQEIVLLGHSQGGLVARIALSEDAPLPAARYRLVSVSSPYSGIDAAEHCGWLWLHIASLGITAGVCQAVTGSKWTEIPPNSKLWREPKALHPPVAAHLKIITDEAGTCRERHPDGRCREDDFVFSADEQRNLAMLDDGRVHAVVVKAGHEEIVGEGGLRPVKLIEVLQRHRVLAPTPPTRKQALRVLVASLFD